MDNKIRPFNEEQHEAVQAESTKQLELFRLTLSEEKRISLDKTQEYIKEQAKLKIPTVVFTKLHENGVHQFNNFFQVVGPNPLSPEFEKEAQKIDFLLINAMVMFMGANGSRRIIICDPDTQHIFLDTHPRKCDL